MEKGVKLSFWERFKYSVNVMLREDTAYHLLFWFSLFIVLTLLDNHEHIGFRLLKESVNISFLALIVYFNIFYIFPIYRRNKSLLVHFILLSAAAALITPIKTAVLYIASSNYSDLQQYILDNIPAIFISTLFFGVISSGYSVINEWMTAQREKQDLQRQSLQTELKFLRSQINPHFLFNTLNSLYALTLKKSDMAPEVVLKISEAMRYMLYECNERYVPLHKEVKYIENYLELEQLRHGSNDDIRFQLHGEISDQRIAPLIFITFIENCFKHGYNNSISERWVDIELTIHEDSCTLIAKNSFNKKDSKKSSTKITGGVGLKNVLKRLELLYPGKHKIDMSERDNLYIVTLEIELK